LVLTRYKQDKDIDIDKDIDSNIMYKYIIFFGVMFKNIIREAKHYVVGRGTWAYALGIGNRSKRTRNWDLCIWAWVLGMGALDLGVV
jgi:hypothetical protein